MLKLWEFLGYNCKLHLAPLDKEEKLILTHDVMLSDDTFPLMLLGNDMFNADKVRTLYHSD